MEADGFLPGWGKETVQGSALDFSGLLDGPAGKYGRVIAAGGKFAFEHAPGRSVRFYGTNLSAGANFLDKDGCRKLAGRLASCGYNSVRLHHHDKTLTQSGGESAADLDPEAMDRLDFLFHCLKERGIYITTDLYVSRLPRESVEELGRPVAHWEEFKFLIHLLDSARENWEGYARRFLEHVNPYTGLAWKDDPALATLNFVNEDAIFHCYKNASPDVRAVYDRRFGKWLEEAGAGPEPGKAREALRNRFLFETCSRSLDRMRQFVRALGCRTLLTGQNHWSIIPMALLRRPCDYVDDHFYWDHPERFELPSRLLNTSAFSDLHSIFSGIFPGRCFGKPYTISEFNWIYPNRFRAESAPLTAAYAALQDWDGLYRYSYAHSSRAVHDFVPSNFFDTAPDPINSLSDRIGILLFLRGDVRSSRLAFPIAVSSRHMEEEEPVDNYPDGLWKLGFAAKIGTVVEREGILELPPDAAACLVANSKIVLKAPAAAPLVFPRDTPSWQACLEKPGGLEKGTLDLEGGLIRSSTGELELRERAGTLLVSTPRTEVLVFTGAGKLVGQVLSAENQGGPCVVCAASLDGATLADSRRILLFHLTDAVHADTRFENNCVENWGSGPRFAVAAGQVQALLKLGSLDALRIRALDLAGNSMHEIPWERTGAGASFTADTVAGKRPCFLYELSR
jgi:hypothetical protein